MLLCKIYYKEGQQESDLKLKLLFIRELK